MNESKDYEVMGGENPAVKVTRAGVRYVTMGDVLGSGSGQALVQRTAAARARYGRARRLNGEQGQR